MRMMGDEYVIRMCNMLLYLYNVDKYHSSVINVVYALLSLTAERALALLMACGLVTCRYEQPS
jgi:hypothetical protein